MKGIIFQPQLLIRRLNMKKKYLPIALLPLICLCLIFSACINSFDVFSKRLNIDENSTVKLTYSCSDEEKNFVAELNAEQSRELILSLNGISYSEVNETIIFGPSYDCLTIKIGSDVLALYDVGHTIKDGGYFYLNGQLCKTEQNFGFLQPYLSNSQITEEN